MKVAPLPMCVYSPVLFLLYVSDDLARVVAIDTHLQIYTHRHTDTATQTRAPGGSVLLFHFNYPIRLWPRQVAGNYTGHYTPGQPIRGQHARRYDI